MWMMMNSNNNHGGDQLKPPPDLVIGRKLRPLMPRPVSSCSSSSSPYSTLSNPSCCCTQNPKILSWNHPMSDHGVRREIHTAAAPLVSTRWNPTPEQLQALEEMYRRGIRTPSAEQIQQIAAKLGRFGKIEGKNVFYWFQNHKARERQKKRRQLELLAGKRNHHAYASDKTQTGLSRRFIETEHHKKVPVPSNCSATPSEDSASMHGAVITAECGKDGWAQLNHKELQHKIATAENETCWQLDLSSCLPPSPNSINAITAHRATGQENTYPYEAPNLITVLPPKNQNQNQNPTLQLFPNSPTVGGEEISHTGTKIRPNDFIEFLPIKN